MNNKKYIIGMAHDEIEVNIDTLNNLLKQGWSIQSQFIKDSFIKLNDGTLIRMFNKDLETYLSEIRNNKIDKIIK